MRSLSLIIFLFLSNVIISQSYKFTAFSIEQGLAQTQVKAITEDQYGYLWVGTLGGLSRFNGADFKNYSSEDGLFNNRITALSSDKEKLWIGHQGGISLLEKRKISNWSLGDENSNINVTKILSLNGKVYIATNGSGIYTFEKGKLRQISLKNDDANRVRGMEISGNFIFLASRDGLYEMSSNESFKKLSNHSEHNFSAICNKENKLFLVNVNGQGFTYDIAKKTLTQKFDIQQEIYLSSCLIDSKKNLWSTFYGGLVLSENGKKVKIIDQKFGLDFTNLNIIYEDRNGTLWIGTDGKGLYRFGGLSLVYFNENNGISSNLITSSLQISSNKYLFGSYDNGFSTFTNRKFESSQIGKSRIWATVKLKDNTIWLGTDEGLVKLEGKKIERFIDNPNSPGNKITCFFKVNENLSFVGGNEGISKIENGNLQLLSVDFNFSLVGTIRNIIQFKGKLYCAADGGLFSFENGKFKLFKNHKLSTYSLIIDGKNNLWFGGETGLFKTNGQKITKVNVAEQPASNYILFLNYADGSIFVGTNNGLYEIKENKTIFHYGIEEGLVNLETNLNSSLVDKQGKLWFGTAEGLACLKLNERELAKKENKPSLSISEIKVNFQAVNYLEYEAKLNSEGLPVYMELPPTKNNLLIELDGISLKKYKNVKYEYFLEGIDENWIPNFSSKIISLSNLPSGNLTLKIRAINEQGKTSNEYTLALYVKPIFYKTWWFISLVFVLITLIFYLFFRNRINREKEKRYKESLEFKTKLMGLEQQSLNASMNRHFIFNSLNSIQYFINSQDKYSANKYLTSFAKLIRKNLDSSSENNNQVVLSEEVERLELYLSLEAMRFKDKFEYEIKTNDIDLESIEVPAMLFQPFVENSIIHGILPNETKKGKICIEILEVNDMLHVIIEDDGIGIDHSIAKKGKFGGDHKSQGMEITAKRILLLNKLSRQDYELEGPIQIVDENRLIKGTRVLIKIPLNNLVD